MGRKSIKIHEANVEKSAKSSFIMPNVLKLTKHDDVWIPISGFCGSLVLVNVPIFLRTCAAKLQFSLKETAS